METQHFPRSHRLTRPAEFKRVFSGATASNDRCFRVLFRTNDRDRCRLGLAVSRRVCRRATGRNRLKRLVRESFRKNGRLLTRNGGIDIVVLPHPAAATISNRMLNESLLGHWERCAAGARSRRRYNTGKH